MSAKPKKEQPTLPGFDLPVEFDVRRWWADVSNDDLNSFEPKFAEYGSEDLAEIGRQMLAIAGRKPKDDVEATEVGAFFYLYGKMARWAEAIRLDRTVSDDTLHDLTVYSMMARLNRAGGMA